MGSKSPISLIFKPISLIFKPSLEKCASFGGFVFLKLKQDPRVTVLESGEKPPAGSFKKLPVRAILKVALFLAP